MMLGALITLAASPVQAKCEDYSGMPLRPVVGHGPERSASWARVLAPIVSDKRIVMLGEPSHGDGASILARAEMAQVLHEHFGFDVLVFEGDFYGLTFGWPELGSASEIAPFAAANLYSFWASVPAARPLWSYIARVKEGGGVYDVAGVDVRLRGELSRSRVPKELSRIAASVQLTVDANAQNGLKDLLYNDLAPSATPDERDALRSLLRQLIDRPLGEDADRALVQSLLAWTQFAWVDGDRDTGMAANLRWLTDHHFSGRKVVVWAHSNHELRNSAVWNGIANPFPRHMGNLFAEGREEEVAVIGTIAHGGVISASFPRALNWQPFDIDDTRSIPSRSADSVEAFLSANCPAPTVLPLPRGGAAPRFKSSAIDHIFEAEADYAQAFDALVFVGQAKPLSEVAAR